MEEKAIVNDVLSSTKACLKDYEGAILETANMELRQTFQNLRNSSETFQYELFKLAESKGYYTPAQNATQQQIQIVKSEMTNS
jgi:spore coat protein CotF